MQFMPMDMHKQVCVSAHMRSLIIIRFVVGEYRYKVYII